MATRAQFEGSNDIGVFSKLTNSYGLVAIGGSENFYSVFESVVKDVVPLVHTTIAGTRIVGRLTAGNRHGLLVPQTTTDQELQVHNTNKSTSAMLCQTQYISKESKNVSQHSVTTINTRKRNRMQRLRLSDPSRPRPRNRRNNRRYVKSRSFP
jgi:translation initiation factor 6 (eIF-6)